MTNLDFAEQATLAPIADIAAWAGLEPDDYDALGKKKAKLTSRGVDRLTAAEAKGRLILVSAVTPTSAGEGKTTVSVGLAQGLNQIGRRAMPALREPALGPLFGVKGGATGGGRSQVLPMEEINLFFTGDFPAITAAHNLLSTILDLSLHQKNPHGLDLQSIWWPRTIDMVDRSLREVIVGLGKGNGPVRTDGFVITPASEVMAILCLSSSLHDLKERLARIVVGISVEGKPVTAGDLGAAAPMAALLKDAVRPNLAQTMEGGAAFIHGGPFGNIAHGCSSVLGTQCGLRTADYLVTEGGFGSDLGGEKFLNIVCPQLGQGPDAIVLVATVRALKHHGAGELEKGCGNLGRHIDHLTSYGPPVVVAVNKFADDTDEELATVRRYAESRGLRAVVCDPWNSGGPGCTDLANVVAEEAEKPSAFHNVYERTDPFLTKLEKLVKKVYGGDGVKLAPAARKQLEWAQANGLGDLPVCVAKTQSSLSDDPKKINAPTGFDLTVREIRVSAGAGFLVAVSGDIMLMPGMGSTPAAFRISVDDDGGFRGLN
ncbi:MAG: formate--tetrahydrofolate ligase [Armatimonadetes bacterium]|nr:formate--tetrahydrofolate ligase [Armatimonadota bacterium]